MQRRRCGAPLCRRLKKMNSKNVCRRTRHIRIGSVGYSPRETSGGFVEILIRTGMSGFRG
jgi:hypothetical protein